ncbi:MAG TPA: PSD1 and planctomycete cytochrome C domain-containing protein [Pirellulales bacterium]|jgi:hypothetical protein
MRYFSIIIAAAALAVTALWAAQPAVSGDKPAAAIAASPEVAEHSTTAAAEQKPPAAEQPVDFAHEILPLLKANCAKCHTAGKYKGDLSMDTRETMLKAKAFIPGKSAESELISRVTSTDPDEWMPPQGQRLSAEQVALLKRWIDQGAPWQDGFSFARQKTETVPLALKRPEVPKIAAPNSGHSANGESVHENPIDRFVDAYFAQNKTAFPPPVDDATFARRVYLDLVGLLPTPEQLDKFLEDKEPGKRERLVDALLANNTAYADHWLTFWNDLLRNDYSGTGYINGGRKQITKWLYDALWENMPYDQFVRELISPSPESAGFINGFVWRGTVNASQSVELQFSQNVGQVFLGVNLKCASCHDSFIDDWKLTDSWGLAAVFSDHPLEIYRCDVPTGKMATPKFLFPELGEIDADKPPKERLAQLAKLITDPRDGRLPRTLVNRLWHRLMGRGIVHPVDAMDGAPWSPELLDYLAIELVDNGYDVKKLLREIATSQIYQARCAEPNDPSDSDGPVFRGPIARRLSAEQFIDAVWHITGTMPAKSDGGGSKSSIGADHRGREPVRASLMKGDLLMRSLGRPNREQVVTTRPDDLSTLEALDLTNGPAMSELLAKGAANWRKEHPDQTQDDLVNSLYLAALCRAPSTAELEAARQIVGDNPTVQSTADLLWCILMLPEFQLVK